MGLMDKLKDAMHKAGKNPDKTRRATHKGADTADDRTGGRYRDEIRTSRDAMDQRFGEEGEPPGRGGA
ncbi:antitoxin [Streptomyces sp. B1866]|uniref:antitoxin n=1 Tax=Streptomyces sp. B1866 TaxID=3075431 RepID=UPI00288E92BB|nr:antitoxin [Streptomyces sp. B1866]MDT3396615.1 antitoxin [Streptomyces sp. B1866]